MAVRGSAPRVTMPASPPPRNSCFDQAWGLGQGHPAGPSGHVAFVGTFWVAVMGKGQVIVRGA